eukprot:TRINITY_DN14272_c0_g1_i1.p1 TRINITY_DN14272_c0_g1~~TRINITY_DN14272_c0_g1_i1.p1  ORF type:complete len:530 (-),score=70.17 TRINITY_DN14272_c0_g1_i1:67-1656(-)
MANQNVARQRWSWKNSYIVDEVLFKLGHLHTIDGPAFSSKNDFVNMLNEYQGDLPDWCMTKIADDSDDTERSHRYYVMYTHKGEDAAKAFHKWMGGLVPTTRQAVKWLLPLLLAGFCGELMSGGLHFATYRYVQKYGATDEKVAAWRNHTVLADPVQDSIPQMSISLWWKDSVSALFPTVFCMWCMYVFWRASCGREPVKRVNGVAMVWTKTLLSASVLMMFKGVLSMVTILPDSSGWSSCVSERLQEDGLAWMREKHGFWEVFLLDWWWIPTRGRLLRYCSDDLFSGHTFAVTLFGLGLYELLRVTGSVKATSGRKCLKTITLSLLCVGTVGEQFLEIWIAESTRFHYTMDIILALVLTFLVYTNGAIAIASRQWCVRGFTAGRAPPSVRDECGELKRSWSDVPVPTIHPSGSSSHQEQEALREWRKMISRADILLPVCCFPFCCFAGREHVYSDADVKELIMFYAENNFERLKKEEFGNVDIENPVDLYWEMLNYLETEMNLNEGVLWEDMHFLEGLKHLGGTDDVH